MEHLSDSVAWATAQARALVARARPLWNWAQQHKPKTLAGWMATASAVGAAAAVLSLSLIMLLTISGLVFLVLMSAVGAFGIALGAWLCFTAWLSIAFSVAAASGTAGILVAQFALSVVLAVARYVVPRAFRTAQAADTNAAASWAYTCLASAATAAQAPAAAVVTAAGAGAATASSAAPAPAQAAQPAKPAPAATARTGTTRSPKAAAAVAPTGKATRRLPSPTIVAYSNLYDNPVLYDTSAGVELHGLAASPKPLAMRPRPSSSSAAAGAGRVASAVAAAAAGVASTTTTTSYAAAATAARAFHTASSAASSASSSRQASGHRPRVSSASQIAVPLPPLLFSSSSSRQSSGNRAHEPGLQSPPLPASLTRQQSLGTHRTRGPSAQTPPPLPPPPPPHGFAGAYATSDDGATAAGDFDLSVGSREGSAQELPRVPSVRLVLVGTEGQQQQQ